MCGVMRLCKSYMFAVGSNTVQKQSQKIQRQTNFTFLMFLYLYSNLVHVLPVMSSTIQIIFRLVMVEK